MDQKSPEAFRTISEVAEWLGVPTHVLRFWESRFSQVKPVKRAGGRRYYRPADMELLGGIRKLLHEDGMTIRGVQKLLREKGVRHVAEMSPSLDMAAETREVTPDNVVDLSNRREAEPAQEPAEATGGDDAEAPWYDSGIFARTPEGGPAPEATEEFADATPDATQPPPEDTTTQEVASEAGQTDVAGDDEGAPVDPGDPLPDPDTMDFLAHDATPEVFETEGPGAGAPTPADPARTDPVDPMSSPDALDFAAHDAQPETHESGTGPEEAAESTGAEGAEEQETAPETAQSEAEAEPAGAETETAGAEDAEAEPAPSLVMPEIADDPADDAYAPDEMQVAARLRSLRGSRVALSTASLRAFADRLDEVADRMHAGGDHSNRT